MSRRTSPLQDKIAQFLSENPLSSSPEICSRLGLGKSTVSCALLRMSENGKALREKDENGCYRYALKTTPQTQISAAPVEEAKKLVKVKTLDDFTPREIFAHLKKLGFKWKPGSMYFEEIKRTYVEFDKI